MKSVRMIEAGKPLEEQDIPIPNIGEKDILVRVRAAGICHSDAHYRAGRSAMGFLPITLGHEVAGVVDKVGSHVTNVKAGDRVCLHYNITCGDCYYCSTGQRTILRYREDARPSCGWRLCGIHRRPGAERDPPAGGDSV